MLAHIDTITPERNIFTMFGVDSHTGAVAKRVKHRIVEMGTPMTVEVQFVPASK